MLKSAISFILLGICLSHQSSATDSCVDIFKPSLAPFEQWLEWEQRANLEKYRKSSDIIELPIAETDARLVRSDSLKATPSSLYDFFYSHGSVRWAMHPWNTRPLDNLSKLSPTGNVRVKLTASRSLALLDYPLKGFTIKIAVDHPHGPDGERQVGKASTKESVESALLNSQFIETQDAALQKDPDLNILKDVFVLEDISTGEGMIFRDIRAMMDGHYYLPAFSIPFVGPSIANKFGKDFNEFWQIHYAAALGRAKAKFLLRYGMQLITPNPQNILIQLDKNFHPTGQILFRDVSDAFLVETVAQAYGLDAQLKYAKNAGYKADRILRPFGSNSFWRMDEGGAMSQKNQKQWAQTHNQEYFKFLSKELGIPISSFRILSYSYDSYPLSYSALSGRKGQKALQEWRSRNLK